MLRARARDGAEVGRQTVPVPAGARDTSLTVVLPISRDAITAEVLSCGYLT